MRVAAARGQQVKDDYVPGIRREIKELPRAGLATENTGALKIAIVKQGSIESDGLQDFGQNIHAGSKLRRSSFGKLLRTLGQVNHILLAPEQENQTLR